MILLDQKDYKGRLKPCTKDGKILWSGDEITNYINKTIKNKNTSKTSYSNDHKPTAGRYNPDKGGANVTYSNSSAYSPNTITKVKKLSRDGKKGKEVLKAYIPAYNKVKKTDYNSITQFTTDVLINDLISFVENTPPADV